MAKLTPGGFGIFLGVGLAGGTLAKLDEGNWGSCNSCSCRKYIWDMGSFGGKYITLGQNNSCAFKRCTCGHHCTQHNRR